MRRNGPFVAQLLFTLLVCAFMFVPIVLSVMAGFTANYIRGISSGLTLRWLFEVWVLYKDAIALSLLISLACLAVTLIVGVPTAYFLAKANHWTTRLIEELLVTPLAVPGLAIALGLIITYGGIREFRSHWTFILVGHVLYTLPFMVRSVLAVLSSIDLKTLEEGAASLGASYWQRFFTIGLPNARSGIVAGALMVLTLSVGEFNITWMLHTPINKTVPVGLADSYASMRIEIGSAYTTVFLLMIVPLLLLIQYIAEPASAAPPRRPWSRNRPGRRDGE